MVRGARGSQSDVYAPRAAAIDSRRNRRGARCGRVRAGRGGDRVGCRAGGGGCCAWTVAGVGSGSEGSEEREEGVEEGTWTMDGIG